MVVVVGCGDDDGIKVRTILTELEGTWEFKRGILDSQIFESWSDTEMEVRILSESSLFITCSNQPEHREIIWPSEFIIYLKRSSSERFGDFYRDDFIEMRFRIDSLLHIGMNPPMEWSYEEEQCPPDGEVLACSERGVWSFDLVRLQ